MEKTSIFIGIISLIVTVIATLIAVLNYLSKMREKRNLLNKDSLALIATSLPPIKKTAYYLAIGKLKELPYREDNKIQYINIEVLSCLDSYSNLDSLIIDCNKKIKEIESQIDLDDIEKKQKLELAIKSLTDYLKGIYNTSVEMINSFNGLTNNIELIEISPQHIKTGQVSVDLINDNTTQTNEKEAIRILEQKVENRTVSNVEKELLVETYFNLGDYNKVIELCKTFNIDDIENCYPYLILSYLKKDLINDALSSLKKFERVAPNHKKLDEFKIVFGEMGIQ